MTELPAPSELPTPNELMRSGGATLTGTSP